MGSFLRPIDIILELAILTGVIYSLFAGIYFTASDLGLNEKYRKFVWVVLMIIGCLALVFFVAHLIAFYPHIPAISGGLGASNTVSLPGR